MSLGGQSFVLVFLRREASKKTSTKARHQALSDKVN